MSLSTQNVYYLLNYIMGIYPLTRPLHVLRLHAFVPYYIHLLLLLNYVVLKALWTIDVYIISTVVNKILYYYYYKRKQLSDTTKGLLIL